MGKIKSKTIKRSAESLLKEDIDFTKDFEKNKKILGNTMPSKKIKNQLAGFLARLKKQEEKSQIKITRE